eukprot:evm.model.scf_13EXC.6 EVM.evm.TU.scf_13EXC.6   scf_13EXC:104573-108085(+)
MPLLGANAGRCTPHGQRTRPWTFATHTGDGTSTDPSQMSPIRGPTRSPCRPFCASPSKAPTRQRSGRPAAAGASYLRQCGIGVREKCKPFCHGRGCAQVTSAAQAALPAGDPTHAVPAKFFASAAWPVVGRGLAEIAFSFALAAAVIWVIERLQSVNTESIWAGEAPLGAQARGVAGRKPLRLLKYVFKNAATPISWFLWVGATVHSFRVAASVLDNLHHMCRTCTGIPLSWDDTLHKSIAALHALDNGALKVMEFLVIILGVWVIVGLKDLYISTLVQQTQVSETPRQLQDMRRMIVPLNKLTSWLLIGFGIVMALQVFGVNIQPFLTVGGVSGLVVGLSAQSVLANLISGINLFLSRPFVIGDRVEVFATNGNRFLSGVISDINPLRTYIQTDQLYPVMVPNKVLTELVVGNESRGDGMQSSRETGGRRVAFGVTMSYDHFHRVCSYHQSTLLISILV